MPFKKINKSSNRLFMKNDCHVHSIFRQRLWLRYSMKLFKSSKRERQMPRGLRARVIRRWISPVALCTLRREWQKGLTAFRRPFKPPRRGPTPDRKRRSAEQTGRPADRRTDRPAGRLSVDVIWYRATFEFPRDRTRMLYRSSRSREKGRSRSKKLSARTNVPFGATLCRWRYVIDLWLTDVYTERMSIKISKTFRYFGPF